MKKVPRIGKPCLSRGLTQSFIMQKYVYTSETYT